MLPISQKIPNISFDQAKTVHGGYYIRKQHFRQVFRENLRRNVIYLKYEGRSKIFPLENLRFRFRVLLYTGVKIPVIEV